MTICVDFLYSDETTRQTQVLKRYKGLYGQTFPAVRSGGAFGLDEGWKELTNLDADTSNTDPEGWVLE